MGGASRITHYEFLPLLRSPTDAGRISTSFQHALLITKMTTIDKNELLEFTILKHVEESPKLNNRMAASKLGCSVKLAHALLGKMVDRGLLHVKKLHARRWDYFLTPKGITEKARLTYEFIDFSMNFYQEARKASSRVCRQIAEAGNKKVAFLGSGDLAEIVYLGVKEWNLELIEVYNGDTANTFLGHSILPVTDLRNSHADTIIICLYDKKAPMRHNYLPEGIPRTANMHWVFENVKQSVNETAAFKKTDNYNAKYEIWKTNTKVAPLPQMTLPFNFSPQKFSCYEEMNEWKNNLIIKIAQHGGVQWSK